MVENLNSKEKGNHFVATGIIYAQAAEKIIPDKTKDKVEQSFMIFPQATMYCFALECLLKGLNLLEDEGYSVPRTHDLVRLFNSLDRSVKESISHEYLKSGGVGVFSEKLEESKNQFMKTRYFLPEVFLGGENVSITIHPDFLQKMVLAIYTYIELNH